MGLTPFQLQFQIGILTDEQKKKAVDWVVQKWGNGNPQGLPMCDMCKDPKMSWDVGNHILSPLVLAGNAPNVSGVVYPVISIMCSNCGETHYINALSVGIMERLLDKPVPENPPPPDG